MWPTLVYTSPDVLAIRKKTWIGKEFLKSFPRGQNLDVAQHDVNQGSFAKYVANTLQKTVNEWRMNVWMKFTDFTISSWRPMANWTNKVNQFVNANHKQTTKE